MPLTYASELTLPAQLPRGELCGATAQYGVARDNAEMDVSSLVASAPAQSPPAWFGVVFALGVAALVIAQYIRYRRRK